MSVQVRMGKGNLRERIKVGDELTFKFKIVEEYATEDYTFETLNYFSDFICVTILMF